MSFSSSISLGSVFVVSIKLSAAVELGYAKNRWAQKAQNAEKLETDILNADHSFTGKRTELASTMINWLKEHQPQPSTRDVSISTDEVQVVRGKSINIFRKQSDGSWKIARRIRNLDHPFPSY